MTYPQANLPRSSAWLVAASSLAVIACGGGEPPASAAAVGASAAAMQVETAPVLVEKVPRYLTLTGSIIADRQSEVAANVAGRVTATYVERGMPVRQGQAIAVVDSKAASLQAAAAMAQSQAAQTQVQQAQEECGRADTLFGQGAISKAEYDRMKSQCTSQLYQANAAQANADLAGKLAGDTIIRAPIDGIIGERYINVGEYVMPASRVASVYAVNPVRVSISVPEPAVGFVKEGQSLDLEVSSWPDRAFPATVRFVSPALRPMTRDLIVEAEAKNVDGALRPGMFATVRLVVGEDEQPTVPEGALRSDGTIKRIFIAKNGSAHEMVVRTGVKKDGRIAVLDTLSVNEPVIVNPPPELHDGASIH